MDRFKLKVKVFIFFLLLFMDLSGKNIVIGGVKFEGNRYFKDKELVGLLSTKPGDVFDKDVFKSDMKKVLRLYKENGFFDVKILKKEQRLDLKKHKVIIYVYLDEGKRFKVERIRYRGNVNISSIEIKEHALIKEGDFYKATDIEKDIRRLTYFYKNNGFPFVFIKDTVMVTDSFVIILYDIMEGPKVTWRKVNVLGLKRYRKKDIEKYVRIKKGAIYRAKDIEETRILLYKSGLVKSVNMDLKLSEDSSSVDLYINVEEKKSKSLSLKVAYQWILNGFLGLTYEDNYFLNANRKLRLSGYVSGGKDKKSVTKLEGGLVFPFIKGSDYSFLVKGRHRQDKSDTIWYVSNELGGYVSREKNKFIPTFSIVGKKEYYQKDDSTNLYVSVFLGHNIFYNGTDNKLSPHNGIRFLCDIGVGYVVNRNFPFFRLFSELYLYKMFLNRILNISVLRGGIIYPYPVYQLSPEILFSMGGDNSLRGYKEESIGKNYLGYNRGTRLLKIGEELRFRIYKDLYFGIVFESGFNGFNLIRFYNSYGIGLRYDTIIGFIRIDWFRNIYGDNSFYLGIGDGL